MKPGQSRSYPYPEERERFRSGTGPRGPAEESDYTPSRGGWYDEDERRGDMPRSRRFGDSGRREFESQHRSGNGGNEESSAYREDYGGYPDAEFDEPPFGPRSAPRSTMRQEEPSRGRRSEGQGEYRSTYASLSSEGERTTPGRGYAGDIERDRQGPRGYTRSDERIREFICERLAQHRQLDVSDVSVAVSDGCVTLEGTVPERHMKHVIEDTADHCWGVKDVENHIRVAARAEGSTTSSAQEPGTATIVGQGKGTATAGPQTGGLGSRTSGPVGGPPRSSAS